MADQAFGGKFGQVGRKEDLPLVIDREVLEDGVQRLAELRVIVCARRCSHSDILRVF